MLTEPIPPPFINALPDKHLNNKCNMKQRLPWKCFTASATWSPCAGTSVHPFLFLQMPLFANCHCKKAWAKKHGSTKAWVQRLNMKPNLDSYVLNTIHFFRQEQALIVQPNWCPCFKTAFVNDELTQMTQMTAISVELSWPTNWKNPCSAPGPPMWWRWCINLFLTWSTSTSTLTTLKMLFWVSIMFFENVASKHECSAMTCEAKLPIALRNQSFDSALSPQRSSMLNLGICFENIQTKKLKHSDLLTKLWARKRYQIFKFNTQTRHISLILWLREILAAAIIALMLGWMW